MSKTLQDADREARQPGRQLDNGRRANGMDTRQRGFSSPPPIPP